MTTASVLVGVPDTPVEGHTTWEINKIGGSPDLMADFTAATCVKCLSSIVHVMQIYCPLELSPFHRVLHMFVCTNKSCWNKEYGWKVYRSQLKDTHSSIKHTSSSINSNGNKVNVVMETNSWCEGADDWGDEDDDNPISVVSSNQADTKSDPSFMVSNSKDSDKPPIVAMVTSSQDGNNSNCVAMVSSRQGLENLDNVAVVSSGENDDNSNVVAMVSNSYSADNSDPVTMDTCGQVSPVSPAVSSPDDSLILEMDELDMRGDTPSVIEEDSVILSSKESVLNVLGYLATGTSQSEDKTLVNHQSDVSTDCVDENPNPLESYYLNVFEEPACEDSDGKHAMKLLRDYERKERVNVCDLADSEPRGGSKSGTEKYEKAVLKHGDRCFHKFIKTLKRCPEQVVRYHYGGTPLLIRELPPGFMPPPCPDCHAPRQFELQLVPALISHLRHTGSEAGPVVEFGTVLVYTCSQSCWVEEHPTPREEFVIVQPDPDQYLFKT